MRNYRGKHLHFTSRDDVSVFFASPHREDAKKTGRHDSLSVGKKEGIAICPFPLIASL